MRPLSRNGGCNIVIVILFCFWNFLTFSFSYILIYASFIQILTGSLKLLSLVLFHDLRFMGSLTLFPCLQILSMRLISCSWWVVPMDLRKNLRCYPLVLKVALASLNLSVWIATSSSIILILMFIVILIPRYEEDHWDIASVLVLRGRSCPRE
jgi:hypothetical protein